MRSGTKIIIVGVMIHVAIFSWLSILLYRNIGFGLLNGGDFANVNQVLWSTIHGRFMQGTTCSYVFNTTGPYSHFAMHFEPFYFFILPFYALLPGVEILIFIKSIFLGLAAFPLYLIARHNLGTKTGLIMSFAYLFSPVIALQGFYPLHTEEYAVFFIPWLFYFFEKDKFRLFTLFAILTMLIKESMPITIFMFGIYALIRRRPFRWSVPFMVLSLAYFIIVVYAVIPYFAEHHSAYSTHQYSSKVLSFNSISDIWKDIFSPKLLGSLIKFLVPFGLIAPFLSPVVVFMLSDIAIKLGIVGVEYGAQHSSVPITIFIFISLIYLMGWLSQACGRSIVIGLAVLLFISMAVRSRGFLNPRYYKSKPYYEAQVDAINFIPPEASVSTPNYMLPYLSSRFELDELGRSKYSDLHRGYRYIVLDTHWEVYSHSQLERAKELASILPKSPDYNLVFEESGILIYQKIK